MRRLAHVSLSGRLRAAFAVQTILLVVVATGGLARGSHALILLATGVAVLFSVTVAVLLVPRPIRNRFSSGWSCSRQLAPIA